MENASKALIMAGEILIGILVIGVLVYGYTNIRSLKAEEQGGAKSEQLAALNREYESYNRKLLRGVDVISVINKAIDNNNKYEYENAYNISISFELIEELAAYKKVEKENPVTHIKETTIVREPRASLKKRNTHSI